jgi:hypothetical protein
VALSVAAGERLPVSAALEEVLALDQGLDEILISVPLQ